MVDSLKDESVKLKDENKRLDAKIDDMPDKLLKAHDNLVDRLTLLLNYLSKTSF